MQSHATDHQNETKQSEYKELSSQFSMLYSFPSEHLTILTYEGIINLLRMWKSFSSSLESTSDYTNDYYHLIDAMPDWQEGPNRRDSSTKKRLHDLVNKAENSSLMIGGSNSFFSKSKAVSAAVGVASGVLITALLPQKVEKKLDFL